MPLNSIEFGVCTEGLFQLFKWQSSDAIPIPEGDSTSAKFGVRQNITYHPRYENPFSYFVVIPVRVQLISINKIGRKPTIHSPDICANREFECCEPTIYAIIKYAIITLCLQSLNRLHCWKYYRFSLLTSNITCYTNWEQGTICPNVYVHVHVKPIRKYYVFKKLQSIMFNNKVKCVYVKMQIHLRFYIHPLWLIVT